MDDGEIEKTNLSLLWADDMTHIWKYDQKESFWLCGICDIHCLRLVMIYACFTVDQCSVDMCILHYWYSLMLQELGYTKIEKACWNFVPQVLDATEHSGQHFVQERWN